MQRVEASEEFICPFGCMISGPSMSGKSYFILELLRRSKEFFLPPPDRIVYAYGSWQPAFTKVHNIEFVDGVDGLKGITFDPKVNNLLVLDDLMEELSSDKNASTLFTRDMHHKKRNCILHSTKPVQAGQKYARYCAQLSDIDLVQFTQRPRADQSSRTADWNQRPGSSISRGY